MISDRYKDSIFKCSMTFMVIVINIIRKPELLIHPRFYAEEGQSFFAFAYNNTLLQYIFTPMYGYYAMYNVISTSLATIFPLEIAPLITIYQALIVQIITSVIVIWYDIPILDSNLKKYFVAISFPLLSPSQVWLTTIGVQYWLCIATALILLSNSAPKSKPVQVVNATVLVLTGLTGILSCLMTPVFLLKWIKSRSKEFKLYTYILSICSIMQILIFLNAYLNNDIGLSSRFVSKNSLTYIISIAPMVFFGDLILYKENILIPIVDNISKLLNFDIVGVVWKHGYAMNQVVDIVLSMLFVFLILSIALIYKRNIDLLALLFTLTLVFIMSVLLSVNMHAGPRYTFAPSAMLMIFFIASYNKSALGVFHRSVVTIVLSMIMLSHIIDYVPSMDRTYNDKWPKWEDEVRHWRTDSNYPLKIWPPQWEMFLNKQKHE